MSVRFVIGLLLSCLICVVLSSAESTSPSPIPPFRSPYKFPLYKQCDPRWGKVEMGVPNGGGGKGEDDTICHQGCAMSSLAMSLAGHNITLPGSVIVTPLSLNKWLRTSSPAGYMCAAGDCCNLVLDAPNQIDPTLIRSLGEPQKPFLPDFVKFLEMGLTVIAHVRNRSHFVLVTGFEPPSTLLVHDPGFPKSSYDYEEVADILLYEVLAA